MARRSMEAEAWKYRENGEGRKVPVVYYLSKNGQLEHPHFIEVPLASTQGLYLRDVIKRLNVLRGKGMASLYSWSSKRSYKNGYVWHDLSENDFVYPSSHAEEYVLKGSEIVMESLSWSSIDDHDLNKSGKIAADASTQTTTTTNRTEKEDVLFSPPPPSSSSAETIDESANICNPKSKNYPSGRSKASAVLMQLISCGSVSVNDDDKGMGMGPAASAKSFNGIEDKEYFSGSLIETRKDEFPALKRSSSYTAADRGSKFEMEVEGEMEGGRFKCIPRKSIKREDDTLV